MEPTINPSLLSAADATALLGIKRETLYAYVSRGLVRSVRDEGGRERRYVRADLELLKARHDARAGHGAVAGAALRWGEPVLDSAISAIDPARGPRYRGHDAVALAEAGRSIEEVAELLWGGVLPETPRPEPFVAKTAGFPVRKVAALAHGASPLTALSIVVPLIAVGDLARFASPLAAELTRARTTCVRLAASLGLSHGAERVTRATSIEGIAKVVLAALGAKTGKEPTRVIDQALVLCADHELNASTFAARVAASSGADLYACLSAAIATLSGPLHGGACDQTEALVREVGTPDRARAVVHERSRRGEAIPGFGHRLYPAGDPRATLLLDTAQAIAPRDETVRVVRALVRVMRDSGRELPTLDAGLVAIAAALGLPTGSALALFAIGRTAGWIAHILEQREARFLLRPRARYVGP